MVKYVRGRGSDTWHWCTNCTQYPTDIVETRDTRPSFDLCNQCKSKEDEGTCKT